MISIIIPTYNERGNIRLLFGRIIRVMEKNAEKFEIIIVDDNSPDGTGREVEEFGKKDKRIKLIKRSGKLGLSSAVMAGVENSSGEKIIVMDADLSHPPEKIPEIANALDNCDIVIGSRNIAGGGVRKWPVHRKAISLGATALAKTVLETRASDPMSGFFGVKKKIISDMKIKSRGYKILMSILAGNRKLEIREVPYFFEDRRAGKTKLGNMEILTFVGDLVRVKLGL
ncbi:MAG: polyprenol monophosphomannose synthase [Candidatus Micrarchaeia archaeon]